MKDTNLTADDGLLSHWQQMMDSKSLTTDDGP